MNDHAPRKKPIADAEWVVTIQLEIGDEPYGEPLVLRYNDAYVAKEPRNVGWLISGALNQRAQQISPSKTKRAKK